MTPSLQDQDKADVVHLDRADDDTDVTLKDKIDVDGVPAELALSRDLLPPVEKTGLFRTLKVYRFASLLCVLAAVGAMSDGFQVQMSGSIVALPGFINQFGDLQPNGKRVINPQYLALWGALKNVAAVCGGGLGSYPTDRFGRRWMILVIQIIMIGACILEQLATHWTHWLGARLMDGFSIGLAQCVINVYISEIAPTAGRGALMSLVNLLPQYCAIRAEVDGAQYNIGSFLSAISLNIVSQDVPRNWRHAVLSQFALSGAAIIAWVFLPESPRWHCAKGRKEEAQRILTKINGMVEGYDVELEYTRMLLEIEDTRVARMVQGGGTYRDVFRGTNLRRLVVSFLPWHWQVAIGVPIMGTYSSYFYAMAGLSNPFNGTVATNCVGLVMLIAAVPLIERLGRRTLLIWVAPVCIASLLAIGGVVRSGSSSTGGALVALASVQDSFSSRASEFPLSGLQLFHTVLPHSGLHPPLFLMPPLLLIPRRCLWQAAYSLGVGPMGYVYVAETSTMRLRAKTTGLAITGIQAMATVYVYIAPIMLNAPGLGMSNTVFFWAGTGTLVYILDPGLEVPQDRNGGGSTEEGDRGEGPGMRDETFDEREDGLF
ncbi:hypothetical protein EHS25_006929 [Saitozyma podzolica]|uniref:Major facilitator superfamily (MFS) profile domain-containing protein n=1 Tax=Saitozyma podzolica TaxID=1890683 RepID=A0A427XRG0_9TREE|nr:hypothetical protein EHS25_006929 [Saitozyma podzolica]